MSQRRSRIGAAGRTRPNRWGQRVTRLGLVVVAATLPVVAGLLAETGTAAVAPARAGTVLTGSLSGQTGTAWLFHAAALGLFVGCWLVGTGLLVDGFD